MGQRRYMSASIFTPLSQHRAGTSSPSFACLFLWTCGWFPSRNIGRNDTCPSSSGVLRSGCPSYFSSPSRQLASKMGRSRDIREEARVSGAPWRRATCCTAMMGEINAYSLNHETRFRPFVTSANTVSDSNTPLKSQKKMTSIVVLNCKTTVRDAAFKLWMTLMETQN